MKNIKLFSLFLLGTFFLNSNVWGQVAMEIPDVVNAAKCDEPMEGDNVYKGYIDNPYLEGFMKLVVTPSGTQIDSISISAFLSVNKQEYCCHSTGLITMGKTYHDFIPGDYGAISGVSLMCPSLNDGYQQFTLKLGVDCGENLIHKMYLKEDSKAVVGCFTSDNPIMQNRIIAVTD